MNEIVDTNAEFNQAMTQLDVKIPSKVLPKTPSWLVILLLSIFPPAAFYFMWKDEAYHGWFAPLNWLFGFSLFAFGMFMEFVLLPQLAILYTELGTAQPPETAQYFIYAIFMLSFLQIVFGFVLKMERKKVSRLPALYLFASILFFILDYVIPYWFFLSALSLTALTGGLLQ